MNPQQLAVYESVLQCIDSGAGGVSFLNGPGSTGKTFTYQAINQAIHGQSKIVPCVASSGIASILLPRGHIPHSCLNIPLYVDGTSHCIIPENGLQTDLLKKTVVIIWDEVPMQHRYCMQTVDCTLQEVFEITFQ
jgi:hypothetical protein